MGGNPVYGPSGSDERLRGDLPAKETPVPARLIPAAEDVEVDLLEVEDREEIVEVAGHGPRSSTLFQLPLPERRCGELLPAAEAGLIETLAPTQVGLAEV